MICVSVSVRVAYCEATSKKTVCTPKWYTNLFDTTYQLKPMSVAGGRAYR